jgi:hypothetical protein
MKSNACKNYEKQMVLYLYRELSAAEGGDLERHLGECRSCARQFDEFKHLYGAMAARRRDLPQTDWDQAWRLIQGRLQQRSAASARRKLTASPAGWAILSAAAAAIFALGILLGKFWLFSPGKTEIPHIQAANYLSSVVHRYVEDIRPILIEYANYSPDLRQWDDIAPRNRLIADLLLQNRLLRKRFTDDKNLYLLKLLEELEIILTEISNLTHSDPQSLSLIRELIKERQILFKLRMLQAKKVYPATL